MPEEKAYTEFECFIIAKTYGKLIQESFGLARSHSLENESSFNTIFDWYKRIVPSTLRTELDEELERLDIDNDCLVKKLNQGE